MPAPYLPACLQGWVTPATKKKREAEAANATLQVTGAVGWRKEGLRYKKNEVFLDVIETVSMLMSAQASTGRKQGAWSGGQHVGSQLASQGAWGVGEHVGSKRRGVGSGGAAHQQCAAGRLGTGVH
jgi:hypothetical protein